MVPAPFADKGIINIAKCHKTPGDGDIFLDKARRFNLIDIADVDRLFRQCYTNYINKYVSDDANERYLKGAEEAIEHLPGCSRIFQAKISSVDETLERPSNWHRRRKNTLVLKLSGKKDRGIWEQTLGV